MVILLLFAFLSGLITIFAPCIWPLLPIILSASATGEKRKPLGITVGILISFGILTLTISYLVTIIPFDPDSLRFIAVFVIGFLGLTLLIPPLAAWLEGKVTILSGAFGSGGKQRNGFIGGLVTGLSLGVVWTPCAGPILATIATLAATRAVNIGIVLVTIAYLLGVGIPLFFFATLGSRLFTKSKLLSRFTGRVQQAFGVLMILTAVAIWTNYDKTLQAKLLDAFPSYSIFLTGLENTAVVKKELDALKGEAPSTDTFPMRFPTATTLPKLGTAPEFTGIAQWLNSEPLTMGALRGKVVLIDFWTYTCINCIRTLPHVTSWYEKYKDQGFVVVGVHTPEFEFEKKTDNVKKAIEQYNIQYPVAQDNDYATWRAYRNRYWPAKYLIDAQGNIRYTHFGEGQYEETEHFIQQLLQEAGKQVSGGVTDMPDQTPQQRLTPETYLGAARMEFLHPQGRIPSGTRQFQPAGTVPLHSFGLGGEWMIADEYATAGAGAVLEEHFFAGKVFLVMSPGERNGTVRIFLDGVAVPPEVFGRDVQNSTVTVTEERLYELLNLPQGPQDHTVRLEFTPGISVFAFTFG